MTIEELNMPLDEGRTAVLFPWQDEQVLKLFLHGYDGKLADQEAFIQAAAHRAGLPVPEPANMVFVAHRHGLPMERVYGPTMLAELARRPWQAAELAAALAELHVKVHHVIAPENIPSQHERTRQEIEEAAELPDELRQAALALLDSLPDGNRLCHGEFHTGNVMMGHEKPMIIDWCTGACGNPLGDAARTAVILSIGKTPKRGPIRWLVNWVRRTLYDNYTKTYLEKGPANETEFLGWRTVMAAAHLKDARPRDQETLLQIVRQGLDELYNRPGT